MNKKNLIILGSHGMLGQTVKKYFMMKKYNPIIINTRFESNNIVEFIEEINSISEGIVINCIGKIKQKSTIANDLFWSNTILPMVLAKSLKQEHLLIHPSTDCIFSGNTKKLYAYNSKHDAKDSYGISKSLAELAFKNRENSLIVRVSIIGPDKYSNKGLLSWFLSNPPNSELNGFINHFWNGITTLEWCQQIELILTDSALRQKYFTMGIVQLGTKNIYSKFEMLNLFNQIFEMNFKIKKKKDIYTFKCLQPLIYAKALDNQLYELKNFMNNI